MYKYLYDNIIVYIYYLETEFESKAIKTLYMKYYISQKYC